jgi:hypothetical protein
VPATLPQHRVCDRQGLDSPIESPNKFINRATALARALSDHGNTREHIFDAVIELGQKDIF